jgi:hypothetical protein
MPWPVVCLDRPGRFHIGDESGIAVPVGAVPEDLISRPVASSGVISTARAGSRARHLEVLFGWCGLSFAFRGGGGDIDLTVLAD